MPTLRLLLALFLIGSGTTGASFAISGYFEPRQTDAKAKAGADGTKTKLELAVPKPRQRFVAIEAKAKPAAQGTALATASPPAHPKATIAKAVAKKPTPGKDGGAQKDGVQEAAVWWPLSNLFKN